MTEKPEASFLTKKWYRPGGTSICQSTHIPGFWNSLSF